MNTVPELLAAIQAGEMVVVLDDEDRENEGDLIMAAELVRPQDINFMATNARGLICLALRRERCQQLKLPLMVAENQARMQTNFTVSIEAAQGVTTGISAYDRAHTVRTAVKPDAAPEDINQPGHIFPLMARPGGVLTRAGHTEAGVDLVYLAGLEPAAVLVEVLNEDGTMARRPELEAFAKKHGLKIGTIADLIRHRLQHDTTVVRKTSQPVTTPSGDFTLHTYYDEVEQREHWAMVRGEPQADRSTLVRVHVQDFFSDVLQITEPGHGLPLRVALAEIDRRKEGVVVVLGQTPEYADQSYGSYGGDEANAPVAADELRTYGIGAQILRDLGVRHMQVMSTPKHFHALGGFGLEVDGYWTPDQGEVES